MNKFVTSCQLAFKARKVAMGDRLIPSIQSGHVYLVVFSSKVGSNRKKKLKDKCTYYQIPWIEMDGYDFNTITHQAISSFGITDKKFANLMIEKGKVTADGIQN